MPQSCQRMLLQSSQTLLEADSQNTSQVIHRLPSNCQSGGLQWKLLLKMPWEWKAYVSVREDNQTKKWVAGELQPQLQQEPSPGSELGAVPLSNTWVTALCLISWDNSPSVEASSKHVLKWRYKTEDTEPKAHFMLNYHKGLNGGVLLLWCCIMELPRETLEPAAPTRPQSLSAPFVWVSASGLCRWKGINSSSSK